MPNLRYKKQSTKAFCDLLEYAFMTDDDIIVLKNGSLCRIYEITPNIDEYISDEQAQYFKLLSANALLKLDGGFSIFVEAIRHKDYAYNVQFKGSNAFAKNIDKKRALYLLKHPGYKTSFFICLCKKGDTSSHRALQSFFQNKGQKTKDPIFETKQVFKAFKEQTDIVYESLKAICKIELLGVDNDTILRSHKALSFIGDCIYQNNLPIAFPKAHVYLDALLSSKEFKPGLCPQIGEKFIGVVAIDGLPSEAYFLILNSLAFLKHEYRFHTRFICQDKLQSAFNLEKYRRLWLQKRRGILAQIFNNTSATINADAQEQLEDLTYAKKLLDKGEEIFGFYTASIIILNKDFSALKNICDDCVKAIEKLGFLARVETINATEAYLGSLPGHTFYDVRRSLISNSVLCDLLPLSAPFKGEVHTQNPLYKESTSLLQAKDGFQNNILLNIHDKDLGNGIVIGPPGSGKSVFLGHLILNLMRYQNMQIFCFDKGESFKKLCVALDGENLNLNTSLHLSPLEFLESSEDINLAYNFIETLLYLNDTTADNNERHEILEALKILSKNKEMPRSLADLALLISSHKIKDVILQYTKNNVLGGLLDGTINPPLNTPFTLFECSNLFDYAKRQQVPVLKQIFALISRKFDGSHPGAIIIDEAWLMLKHQICAEEILKWIKTLRKLNVVVILATQSLSDLKDSPLFSNILDCIKTRFYLPNPDAMQEGIFQDYENFGLSKKQIEKISKGIKKQEIFMQKSDVFMQAIPLIIPEELEVLSPLKN